MLLLEREKSYKNILSNTYLKRQKYRKGYKEEVFKRYFRDVENEYGEPPWLSEDEFKENYRMYPNRKSFFIVDKIKHHLLTKNEKWEWWAE